MPNKKAKEIPVGKRIRSTRIENKITVNRVANETGFSIDYLKKVESGKAIPPVSALLQIARAIELDSGYLLREGQSRVKKDINPYPNRTDNYAYTTLSLGTEHSHLKAFRVVIEAHQEHKGVSYQHEGEEFVFLLTGRIEVSVGEHVNTLDTGDSLHFNSNIEHKMRNISDKEAKLIVVIYTP